MLVKKYSNRRLYDTESSRYITLEELAQKVQAGADCRVLDAKTGADLTQATLTQIILESRRGAQLLPIPLLLSLIRMKDDALTEFFGRYVTWALELYTHAKQGAQTVGSISPLAGLALQTNPLARFIFGGTPGMGGMGLGNMGNMGSMGGSMGNIGFEAPPPSSPAPTPAPRPAPSSDDVADLRRELQELKDALRRPAPAESGAKPPRSRKRQ